MARSEVSLTGAQRLAQEARRDVMTVVSKWAIAILVPTVGFLALQILANSKAITALETEHRLFSEVRKARAAREEKRFEKLSDRVRALELGK